MRRLILGTLATAAIVVGISSSGFAAPTAGLYGHDGPNPQAANLHLADYYYWNHHRYHHRDWDRDHHRWHYYD